MDRLSSDFDAIKPEPETISEEGSSTSHCDAILQYGIVKQKTEDTCEPVNPAAYEHVKVAHCSAFSEIDIDCPDFKKKFSDHLERIDISRGSIYVETVTIKAELGPREEDEGGIPYMENDIDRTDVKRECLQRFGRINQTEVKTGFHSLQTHRVEKRFSCSLCNYSCSRKTNLERHLFIHTGKKPFSCSKCAYSCSLKHHLTSHMLTHSGEKPFSCSECNYSCSRKSHLTDHKLTHSGEKPFLCSECNYSCSRKSHMTSHTLTHSREKPFSCSECGYLCSQNSHLTTHMLTHSREKRFSCYKCNYSCSLKGNLTSHILTHSGE